MTPLERALAYLPDGWSQTPGGRRAATEDDPLLFAWTYLRHHLRSDATDGEVTFSEAHLAWCDAAKGWMKPPAGPMESRDAYVAPRETGKSTWWYLILPLWGAAHGWVKFAAAFADSATQAETHLRTLKHELDTNERLRTDYPDLVSPARRPRGQQVADNAGMLQMKSGFVFAARGIDSGNLGMKVGELRPDLLILDDVEPGESNYSSLQMTKRLGTLRDVIFPLNVNARVVIVGTVTMPGSIIHQLVRSARGGEVEPWIIEERIDVHFFEPIIANDDGSERSLWPARWSLEFLNSIRHTRSYAKNYANDPMGIDGAYWSDGDFVHPNEVELALFGATKRILSIDPAVTTKKSSDPSALAIVSFAPPRPGSPARCLVEHVVSVRLAGKQLRELVLRLLERWDSEGRPIGGVLVETNQGGDLWEADVFHTLPVRVHQVHQKTQKELRAAEALTHYQRGHVWHVPGLRSVEEQMVGFPSAPHDDEVDAVGSAVNRFLTPKPTTRTGMRVASYA